MWVKSGETVSEISSELSPISISGRVELRNLHSLSDQKKLLSISRTKHILVFNMSLWFWRTLSKCFKFVFKSVDLQLWSVYHGRQWFFSETQVTKTMLEKSVRKEKIFRNMGAHVNTFIRSDPRHPLKLGLFPHTNTMSRECPIGGFEATWSQPPRRWSLQMPTNTNTNTRRKATKAHYNESGTNIWGT